jgi:hypothetical protein
LSLIDESLLKIIQINLFFLRSYSQEDPLQIHLPPIIVPTPPSSPHIELLRQHYAYLLANSTNNQHQNTFAPSTYECLMAQKILAQQFLDNYRTLTDQQYQTQQCCYTLVEGRQFIKSYLNNLFLESIYR